MFIVHAPMLLNLVSRFEEKTALAIWPFIFTKAEYPFGYLIERNKVYLRQQLQYFFIGFAVLYYCSKKWRYKFELQAYREIVKIGFPRTAAARILSGLTYGEIVSYQQAFQDLEVGL